MANINAPTPNKSLATAYKNLQHRVYGLPSGFSSGDVLLGVDTRGAVRIALEGNTAANARANIGVIGPAGTGTINLTGNVATAVRIHVWHRANK